MILFCSPMQERFALILSSIIRYWKKFILRPGRRVRQVFPTTVYISLESKSRTKSLLYDFIEGPGYVIFRSGQSTGAGRRSRKVTSKIEEIITLVQIGFMRKERRGRKRKKKREEKRERERKKYVQIGNKDVDEKSGLRACKKSLSPGNQG